MKHLLSLQGECQGGDGADPFGYIPELAQSLRWNPVSIYEWVKDNIETEWYWESPFSPIFPLIFYSTSAKLGHPFLLGTCLELLQEGPKAWKARSVILGLPSSNLSSKH